MDIKFAVREKKINSSLNGSDSIFFNRQFDFYLTDARLCIGFSMQNQKKKSDRFSVECVKSS